MSEDPEWQRIERLGRIAGREASFAVQITFLTGLVLACLLGFAASFFAGLPGGMLVVIFVVLCTLPVIWLKVKRAFRERDEAMDAYFDRDSPSPPHVV